MRRSLLFVGLLLLLACQTSFAAPATPTPTPAVEPYDAMCHVPIPEGVVVRSLPNPVTCVGPLSDQLKALADTNTSTLAPPVEAATKDNTSRVSVGVGVSYDAPCGVPIPDGVIVRSLPDPVTCVGPMSAALKGLANKSTPTLAPPSEMATRTTANARQPGSFSANAMPAATSTYESVTSGYAIADNNDSVGVLSYLGATYPYNVQMPADNHQFDVWTEAIQPPRGCLYVGIIHERNDYVHYLSGQSDRLIFGNACTATVNYAWGLNDPGVQQQIIITTATGPVAGAQVRLTGFSGVTPCFTSYVLNKVTGTWNPVAQVCQLDSVHPAGYVQFSGTAFGASPLWCPVLPATPWVEATLKYKNNVYQVPNPAVDWYASEVGQCVITNDSYIVTSLITGPYGTYVTWHNQ